MVRIHHFGIVPSRHYFLADNGEYLESSTPAIDPLSAIEEGLEIVLLYVLIADGTPVRVVKAAPFSSPLSPCEFIEDAWSSEPLLRGLPDKLVINQKLFSHLPLIKSQMERHGVSVEVVTGRDKKHSGLLAGAERQVTPDDLDMSFATHKPDADAIDVLNADLEWKFGLRSQIADGEWELRDYIALEFRKPQFRTKPVPNDFQSGSWLWPSTHTRSRPLTEDDVRGVENIESLLDSLTQLGKSDFPWDIKKRHGDSPEACRAAQDEILRTITPYAVRLYDEFKAELEHLLARHPEYWERDQIQLFGDPHMVPHVSIMVGAMGQFLLRRGFDGVRLPPSMTVIDDTWVLQRALPAPAVNSMDPQWLSEAGFEISAWGWEDISHLLIRIPILSTEDGNEFRMALQSSRAVDIQKLFKKAKLTVYCDAKLKGYVVKNAWDVMLRCLAIHPDGNQAPHERFDVQRRIDRWKIDRREVSRTIEIVADLVLAIRSGAEEVRALARRSKEDLIH